MQATNRHVLYFGSSALTETETKVTAFVVGGCEQGFFMFSILLLCKCYILIFPVISADSYGVHIF